MSSVQVSLAQILSSLSSRKLVQEDELNAWIESSDLDNAHTFFAGNTTEVYSMVSRTSKLIVKLYLNNPHVEEVPLQRKTKFCLVLNNFALFPPTRQAVFEALEDMTSIFENSIRDEGTLPFNSELGRMSEHVLVLLMRVTEFKIGAPAVLEFAEHNTQFAVQLLVAIMLKQPAYEFDLRCNCVQGLLGFTQPQTFFSASNSIMEHSCNSFTEKVDFMLSIMLRLQAVNVVGEVLVKDVTERQSVSATALAGFTSTMRMIMNVFKYASHDTTQWRQHILLSTSFLDDTLVLFTHYLVSSFQRALTLTPLNISHSTMGAMNMAFRFGTFATYHLGERAVSLRPIFDFMHRLFATSISAVVYNPQLSSQTMIMYVNLMHFMCNIDAFEVYSPDHQIDIMPELQSPRLQLTVEIFMRNELAVHGAAFLQAWYQQFLRGDQDALVARELMTYQVLDSLFRTLLAEMAGPPLVKSTPTHPSSSSSSSSRKNTDSAMAGPQPQFTPASTASASSTNKSIAAVPSSTLNSSPRSGATTLADAPVLKKAKHHRKKISVEKAAEPIKVRAAPVATTSMANCPSGVNPSFLCALTGNMMKKPVSSPYGHTFEKEAIHNWLSQNGSICPITGKQLTVEDLQPNSVVATQIMQQVIAQSMQAPTIQGEDDIYNF